MPFMTQVTQDKQGVLPCVTFMPFRRTLLGRGDVRPSKRREKGYHMRDYARLRALELACAQLECLADDLDQEWEDKIHDPSRNSPTVTRQLRLVATSLGKRANRVRKGMEQRGV